MQTRCRPGDLAIVIKDDFPENVGKIVKTVRLADPDEFIAPFTYGGPLWECEPTSAVWVWDDDEKTLGVLDAGPVGIEDVCLRPIRPGEGEDEMLRIAGKPIDIVV